MDASRLQISIGMFLLLAMLAMGWTPQAAADTFDVTFSANFGYSLPVYDVTGSFVWDTTAQTFSNAHITDNFGDQMNVLGYADFFAAGNLYGFPAETMHGWEFHSAADPSIGIQYSPGDHAFLGPQVLPQPGTYNVGLFFLQIPGQADRPSSGSWVTVSPVATPEPATGLLALVGLGFLGLNFVMRKGPGAFPRPRTQADAMGRAELFKRANSECSRPGRFNAPGKTWQPFIILLP